MVGSEEKSASDISPTRILIVDDDPDVRLVLRRMLESGGYEISEAGHGRQAATVMKNRMHDLLITDLIMPEQEGIETIQNLRRDYPELKIIAISGAYGSDYLRIARHLGADEIMEKPLRLENVLRTIDGLLKA